MNNIKYIEYIKDKLTDRELLEGLAEEACELAQASLKLIRASGDSNNVTPKREEECIDNLIEEIVDIGMLIRIIFGYQGYYDFEYKIDVTPKWQRWAERLGYKGEGE